MAVIYKCDLCGKEVSPDRKSENPLVRIGFEVPNQDYSMWHNDVCHDCEKMLNDEIVKAKYEFWKRMRGSAEGEQYE